MNNAAHGHYLFNLYLRDFKGGITPSIKFYQNLK